MALLFPILSEIPKVFTSKDPISCKILGIKKSMSFNPSPCQMNCYPSPNTNQGTHFLNITIPISLCTNPLTFVSLSPLAYDTNYYVVHCLSNEAKLRKTIICTKSIHLSCISTYTNTISLPTKIPTSNT